MNVIVLYIVQKVEIPMLRSIIIIVYRMECDKTRWSCPWNSNQTVGGEGGGGTRGLRVVGWGQGEV